MEAHSGVFVVKAIWRLAINMKHEIFWSSGGCNVVFQGLEDSE